MIWLALVLFLLSMFLSAFFSGSETGLYRASRVRLVLDGLSGDVVSRALLWLTNNPALFVATLLIGNNVANNLTSFAIVLGAREIPWLQDAWTETLLPVLLSPIIFVYGELLPKHLFYQAPNRLLRRSGPLLMLFTILFAPVAAVLWALGRLLQSLVGQTPLRVQLVLARQELSQLLREGQEMGILHPAQRQMAQGLVDIGPRRIGDVCTPITRILSVPDSAQSAEVLRLARRHRTANVLVHDTSTRQLCGYVPIVQLVLSGAAELSGVKPLPRFDASQPHVTVIVQLRAAGSDIGLVVDEHDAPVGLVELQQLTDSLLRDKT